MRLVKRVRSENTVAHDAIDRMVFETLLGQARHLSTVIEEGKGQFKTFPQMAEDVFFALYKPSPTLMDEQEIKTEFWLNRAQMEKLMESSGYSELREYSILDELGAGLGTKALLEGLVNEIKDNEDLQKAVEQEDQASGDEEKMHQEVAKVQSTLRRVVTKAADLAVKEVADVEETIISWGLEKGDFQRLPLGKKLELLETLRGSSQFRDLGKLVGRMRRLAIASRKSKLDDERVELHSVGVGDDISHALPQELLALRRPPLKLDFFRKVTEKQLLQYDLIHKDRAGQGPMICLVDTSGSMRKDNREAWSKAVALGLAEIAARQRRLFAYALFAGPEDGMITDEFPRGTAKPEQLVNLAQWFIGGGTDYEQPLRWALMKIRENKFNKADVVMITDGECQVGDEFFDELQRVKRDKNFSIFSVLIGGIPQELKKWSDKVWSVHNLEDQDSVEELFLEI